MSSIIKKNNITTKFFPFSPGIPWKLKNNIIIPELHGDIWHNIINNKNWNVVSYGGFLESVVSLCAIEALHKLNPNKKINWIGDNKFKFLIDFQGIASHNNLLTEDIINKYPVPIFLDKNNNIYFNLLNNYINIYTYFLEFVKKNKKPVFEQIFENLTIKWDYNYIPKLRNINFNSRNFVEWSVLNKFYINKTYIIIIPELNKYSKHITSCLGWSEHEVKALVSLLAQCDISSIIVTNNINKYKTSSIKEYFISPDKLDVIVMLMSKASAILAENIDYLLSSMLLNDKVKILSKTHFEWFDLLKNRNYFDLNNQCIIDDNLNPIKIFNIIKGK